MQTMNLLLALAAFALVTASPLDQRTVAQVETDLTNVGSQATTFDNNINALPNSGGNLVQALAIHSSAQSLVISLNTATKDVLTTTDISEVDGQAIIDILVDIQPIFLDALTAIVSKKNALDAISAGSVSALLKQDLGQLCPAARSLQSALINAMPDDLKTKVQSLGIRLVLSVVKHN
ncbi:hypothetical protein D9758_006496 [Tetrapyrgos nigripes]|uniref:Antigenic cell wall galactomannoprotein n=1 Tax=Tetrapyrgos nigripes TaxID=182062 RepID=A0A8H5LRJ9_9AGAR|nr:hypothetical protein D9758_006496 [Tetrapyrgos nigripes]